MIKREYVDVLLFAILGSLLLSTWVISHDALLNPDGICYLLSAQLFANSSLHDVMHTCPQSKWPFYSFLIYAGSNLSHLSPLVSAHLWDSFFSLLSVVFFILIVKEMGGSKPILWLAACVILLNHQFNILRDEIIRDHGFWAFYLCSIYLLMKYLHTPRLLIAGLWSLDLLVAGLFRVEGFIFLLVIPFVTFFNAEITLQQRAKCFLHLNLPLFLILLTAFILQVTQTLHVSEHWSRINEINYQIQQGISLLVERFHVAKIALATHVLAPEARSDAGLLLVIMLCAWYVWSVIKTLSFVYAILVFYAVKNKLTRFPHAATLVLAGYVFVNLVITCGFLAERFFISRRYLVALTLLLMLLVPYALHDLWQKRQQIRHRFYLIATVFLIFITTVATFLHNANSKSYVRDAGNWVAKNVPKQASFYTNDLRLMFYTHRLGNELFKYFPDNNNDKRFDYLAIHMKKHSGEQIISPLPSFQDAKPIQIFRDHHSGRVVIYRTEKTAGISQ